MPVTAEKTIKEKSDVNQEKTLCERFVAEMEEKAAKGGLRQTWVDWAKKN